MGLEGHIRLSGDMDHERYRGYRRPGRIKGTTTAHRHVQHRAIQNDTTIDLQKQIMTLTNELQELKRQPVQQQPIEEELTREDVLKMIQRANEDKKQQPDTTTERALSEEKQKIVDLKAERELVELLKSQMNGAPSNDHPIMNNAPESLYDELAQYHLSFIGK